MRIFRNHEKLESEGHDGGQEFASRAKLKRVLYKGIAIFRL